MRQKSTLSEAEHLLSRHCTGGSGGRRVGVREEGEVSGQTGMGRVVVGPEQMQA